MSALRNNPAMEMGATWKFRLLCADCDLPSRAMQGGRKQPLPLPPSPCSQAAGGFHGTRPHFSSVPVESFWRQMELNPILSHDVHSLPVCIHFICHCNLQNSSCHLASLSMGGSLVSWHRSLALGSSGSPCATPAVRTETLLHKCTECYHQPPLSSGLGPLSC